MRGRFLQNIWSVWDNFWQYTNIPGANNAGRARHSIVRRGLWLLTFGLGIFMTVLQVFYVADDFVSYPITTSVVLDRKDQVVQTMKST